MRIKDILTEAMGFEFSSEVDADLARSFGGLIKYNNGLWKSEKQATFMLTKRAGSWTPIEARTLFGVDMQEGQKGASIDGYAQWSEYGGRSIRPVSWFYVLDKNGIVRKYKLKFKDRPGGGTTPDETKTKLEWQRPANLQMPDLSSPPKPETPASTSKHVGVKGGRIEIQAKIDKVLDRGESQWGRIYLTILKDAEGNVFMYRTNRTIGGAGEQVHLKATVKDHVTSKTGEPITMISHPKFL